MSLWASETRAYTTHPTYTHHGHDVQPINPYNGDCYEPLDWAYSVLWHLRTPNHPVMHSELNLCPPDTLRLSFG